MGKLSFIILEILQSLLIRHYWVALPFYLYCRNPLAYEVETGDTSTMNDLVTKQYENLPYPEFSPLNISNEERHYSVGMDDPASIFPTHTLEKHNHYLHRGNQNFR